MDESTKAQVVFVISPMVVKDSLVVILGTKVRPESIQKLPRLFGLPNARVSC